MVLVLLLLVGAAIFAVTRVVPLFDLSLGEQCVATTSIGEKKLDPEQAANAATIAVIGTSEGVGERGVAIGIATAIQESKLRNLDHGDRDSLGLFQQRPSQGWGTAAQVTDPVYASTKFFQALKKVPNYQTMELTEAAQAVQRSAYGDLYGEHEFDARVLAGALSGRTRQALTCDLQTEDAATEAEGATGLTPRAVAVRERMADVFGRLSLGGFEPGGVSTGHIEGSAHYEGRAIDVFFRPVNKANKREGWALATWLVAHADDLNIRTVIYDDALWTASRSGEGWRAYSPPGGDAEDAPAPSANPSAQEATRRHLDHVHVDVA